MRELLVKSASSRFHLLGEIPAGAITKFIFNLTFGLNNDSQESSTVKSFWFCESRDGAVVRVLAS